MRAENGPVDGPQHAPVGSDLHRWVATLVEELDVDPAQVDVEAVLDLARDAAHGVARPAVPLTAYLVGYAVGAGRAQGVGYTEVAQRVGAMAREWSDR